MPSLYFTPAAISYLTQLVLSAFIAFLLFQRLRRHWRADLALVGAFFALVTAFIGLMFLESAFSPEYRLLAVYAQNSVLALALVFLIQFAYSFPQSFPQYRLERLAALAVSLAYFLWEAGYMAYRYFELWTQDSVLFRPYYASYAMAVMLALAPLAFVRQLAAADPRPVFWLWKIFSLQNREARGALGFAGVFVILFFLGLANVLLIFGLPHTVYNAAMSIGVLVALWAFAANYINFFPGGGSVLLNLSVLTLAIFLALLGSIGWFLAPRYIASFQPNLTDRQTLRFSPNASGGYDVREVPFSFESDLGEKLQVTYRDESRYQKIDFVFPFYGKTYREVYAANSGAVALGAPFMQPDMQSARYRVPAIFPLMIDLDPNSAPPEGGLYARVDSDAGRLILTWYRLPAYYRANALFTFQAVLYADGAIEMTYNGLPLPYLYNPDETPPASPWLRGIVAGRGEDLHEGACRFPAPCESPLLIENYYREFRVYLHRFMTPLAWSMSVFIVLLLTLLPLTIRGAVTKPLDALLEGVHRMDAGDLDAYIPVQNLDDVGFLTSAFNKMAANLKGLINDLDARVAERTSELTLANYRLEEEIRQREAAQEELLEKQRQVAALEERERLSRDLHDGLGQTMGFINLQIQTIETMLAKENKKAAMEHLARLKEVAQDAHSEIRSYILGLRSKVEEQPGMLVPILGEYIADYVEATGLKVRLSLPQDRPLPELPSAVETQVLHIVQEALANVRKHAEARSVEILFSVNANFLQVVVADDGKGFLPRQRAEDAEKHFGLKMMRERAESFGGVLEIRSKPGSGCKVILSAPLFSAPQESEEETLSKLRILLVDDSPIFIEGLFGLLAARGLNVVGIARDGIEAQEMTRLLRPDIIVMDVMMPRCDGIEAAAAIKAEFPGVKILMLTTSEKEEYLVRAVQAGASGYLFKNMDVNEFCNQLVSLTRGETTLPYGVAARAVAAMKSADSERTRLESISGRQRQILDMLSEGLTYKEIAAALHLSENAIKYHMGQILQRLQVRNRAQAIAFARKAQNK